MIQPVALNVYVIISTPTLLPYTTPVDDPTVVTLPLLLLHVPGDGESLKARVPPRHMFVLPLIADGNGLTVTVAVDAQPVGSVYDTSLVPAVMPLTTPRDGSIVATLVVRLLQLPPAVPSDNTVVSPAHTDMIPVIAAGNGLTVTIVVT